MVGGRRPFPRSMSSALTRSFVLVKSILREENLLRVRRLGPFKEAFLPCNLGLGILNIAYLLGRFLPCNLGHYELATLNPAFALYTCLLNLPLAVRSPCWD
jgi:hypothetical protein